MVSSRLMPGVVWRMKSTVASTSRARVDSKPEISLMVSLRLSCSVLSRVLTYSLTSLIRSYCIVSGSNAVALICSNPFI